MIEKIYICEECGRQFFAKYERKYCSKECRSKAVKRKPLKRMPTKDVTCVVCGRVFKGYSFSKYCSKECRGASVSKELHRERSSHPEKWSRVMNSPRKMIVHKCKHCGEEFKGYRNRVYCSNECRLADKLK